MTRPGRVARAAATGDELTTLEAVRDKLASVMDEAPGYVLPRAASQLSKVLKRIEEIRPVEKESLADALADRRAKREQTNA